MILATDILLNTLSCHSENPKKALLQGGLELYSLQSYYEPCTLHERKSQTTESLESYDIYAILVNATLATYPLPSSKDNAWALF